MDAAVFLYILSFIGLYEASACPSKEDIYPCECNSLAVYREPSKIRIDCNNILNPEQLTAPMAAIERSKTKVSYLYFKNATLLYLPENLFKDLHIKEVSFRDCEIMSLSDTDTAFSGLENDLIGISAVNIKSASHWDFQQLRNLKALQVLILQTMPLQAIDHQIPQLPKLMSLVIIDSEISYIADDAFSNIPKLKHFNMRNNEITEMKRSMLPNPADILYEIDLSENSLSYLPDDFFENMPSLKTVSLQQNKFTTLSEKPFSELFRYRPYSLYMTDNPFHCDCRLHWLANTRLPQFFEAECSTPKALSGTVFKKLDFKRLWC